jgi:regulator of replication initiation timing
MKNKQKAMSEQLTEDIWEMEATIERLKEEINQLLEEKAALEIINLRLYEQLKFYLLED